MEEGLANVGQETVYAWTTGMFIRVGWIRDAESSKRRSKAGSLEGWKQWGETDEALTARLLDLSLGGIDDVRKRGWEGKAEARVE